MNQQEYDPLFEAMLRQAIRDNIYEEAESVPDDDVLATMFTISEKHDKRMRRLCAREDRREQFRAIAHPLKRVAVAAMLLITLLSGMLMINPTVRATVVEVVIEWYEQFARFIGIDNEKPGEPAETRAWSPEYLPEGFREVGVYGSTPTTVEYEDDEANLLIFRYSPDLNELRVDNEESEYYTEEIDGITFYIFVAETDNKPCKIIWFDSNYRFYLSGHLDLDILMDVAKSVKEISQ